MASFGCRASPRVSNGDTSKLQERWEEMNRREKMDREFNTIIPRTHHQIEELKYKKSKEEHRRVQWDLKWKSQSRATASGHSTVALKTSKEPTAPESPDIRNSKSRRGLAKVQELATKPWTKAPEASDIGGRKEGQENNGKKHKKEGKGKGRNLARNKYSTHAKPTKATYLIPDASKPRDYRINHAQCSHACRVARFGLSNNPKWWIS